jgi:hypothetical protein
MELPLEKTVLMLSATPGDIAPAATATKPAISAYSIRSWPHCVLKNALESNCELNEICHMALPFCGFMKNIRDEG